MTSEEPTNPVRMACEFAAELPRLSDELLAFLVLNFKNEAKKRARRKKKETA